MAKISPEKLKKGNATLKLLSMKYQIRKHSGNQLPLFVAVKPLIMTLIEKEAIISYVK